VIAGIINLELYTNEYKDHLEKDKDTMLGEDGQWKTCSEDIKLEFEVNDKPEER